MLRCSMGNKQIQPPSLRQAISGHHGSPHSLLAVKPKESIGTTGLLVAETAGIQLYSCIQINLKHEDGDYLFRYPEDAEDASSVVNPDALIIAYEQAKDASLQPPIAHADGRNFANDRCIRRRHQTFALIDKALIGITSARAIIHVRVFFPGTYAVNCWLPYKVILPLDIWAFLRPALGSVSLSFGLVCTRLWSSTDEAPKIVKAEKRRRCELPNSFNFFHLHRFCLNGLALSFSVLILRRHPGTGISL